MKKRYSKPITECSTGLFPQPVLGLDKSGDEYKQVLDPNEEPTEDDGRSNTVLWDTMDNTF